MLEGMIQDHAHALGDGLILQMDSVDAAVDHVVMLRGTVDVPIVAGIGGKPPAAEPVGRVGQKIAVAPHAADRRSVLERRRLLGQERHAALPPQHAIHGVFIVERYPTADLDMTAELAVRHLRPERKQEVAEAPGGAAGADGAVARVRVPHGASAM